MDKHFPEPALVEEAIRRGARQCPGAVWVIRETDTQAIAAFDAVEIEPVLAGLNPRWKLKKGVTEDGVEYGGDWRRVMRDSEMLMYCTKIVVFKDVNSSASAWWSDHLKVSHSAVWRDRLHVIERGKKKARQRKARKPAGV